MFSDIATLACGNYQNHTNCSDAFESIFGVITSLEKRILELPFEDNETIRLLGPFFGRSLLENVCTALVGRLDPFRLLVVRNVQIQDSFGISSKSKSAIQWFGDIIEKGLEEKERAPEKMWSSNKDFATIGRGLLGDYYGELYWRPAFEAIIDDNEVYEEGPYFENDFRKIPSKDFMNQIRKKLSELYSSLSKGVHSELVIRTENIYDRSTVLNLISEVIEYCALLSLLSHKVPSAICRLEFNDVVKKYRVITDRSDRYGG